MKTEPIFRSAIPIPAQAQVDAANWLLARGFDESDRRNNQPEKATRADPLDRAGKEKHEATWEHAKADAIRFEEHMEQGMLRARQQERKALR